MGEFTDMAMKRLLARFAEREAKQHPSRKPATLERKPAALERKQPKAVGSQEPDHAAHLAQALQKSAARHLDAQHTENAMTSTSTTSRPDASKIKAAWRKALRRDAPAPENAAHADPGKPVQTGGQKVDVRAAWRKAMRAKD